MSTPCNAPRSAAAFCRAAFTLVLLVGAALSLTPACAQAPAPDAGAASKAEGGQAAEAASAAASAAPAATDAAAKRDLVTRKLDEGVRFDVQCEYVVGNSMRQKVVDAFHTFWLKRETLYPDPTVCPPTGKQETEQDGSPTKPDPQHTPKPAPSHYKTPRSERVMHGPGEIVIVVKDEDYIAALKDATEDKPLHLFLNGFDMGTDGDGSLQGVVRSGGLAALLFHAGASGKTSQVFWTDIYHQHGILAYVPLRASIGWGAQPRFVPGAGLVGDPLYVSVSDPTSLVFATLFGGALIVFFAWALRNSDTFRVAPLYPWWLDARVLQTQIHQAVLPFWSRLRRQRFKVDVAMADAGSLLKIADFIYGKYKDISLALQAESPATPAQPAPPAAAPPAVDPADAAAVAAANVAAAIAKQAAADAEDRAKERAQGLERAMQLVKTASAALAAQRDYLQKSSDNPAAADADVVKPRNASLAEFRKALESFRIGWDSFKQGGATPTNSAETLAAVIGLALFGGKVRPLRLPYSLVRVQWGAWMMFATSAAVYLWLVYGEFPALDGSVLGLVTVSTVTAGGSFIVDSRIGTATGYSQGFVFDLMTGTNDVQQAHRYQALVVNVLLFAVGIVYVSQHLAYPVFDASWLGLLTLSGVAQTAGKGILEAPPDKTDASNRQSTAAGA